ncbi:hypothetical protein [Aureisphaera sp.]
MRFDRRYRMILVFCVLISILQLFFYFLSHRLSWEGGKFITVLLIVVGYIYVFPEWFYPEYDEGDIRCGLPTMAATLGLWFFGSIALLVTHIYYRKAWKDKWKK